MKKHRMVMTPANAEKTRLGLKTQTRRVIPDLPPDWIEGRRPEQWDQYDYSFFTMSDPVGTIGMCWRPRYIPGDIVGIAEAHWRFGAFYGSGNRRFKTMDDEMHPVKFLSPSEPPPTKDTVYYHKRPSLFLPYDMCRTYVEIEDVRAERLQKISEEDAIAEGIQVFEYTAVDAFRILWDSINTKRGYPWKSNPFVWKYLYKVEA